MAAADRHAARVAGLRQAVFDSPGVSDLAVRAAAASADGVPPPLDAYVAKVDGAAYRITDADVAALQAAGCSEEEIFEVTVAAAVGAALRGLDAGMRAHLPHKVRARSGGSSERQPGRSFTASTGLSPDGGLQASHTAQGLRSASAPPMGRHHAG